jgi:hypothetical protein
MFTVDQVIKFETCCFLLLYSVFYNMADFSMANGDLDHI